ncbi:unnamed protein product, partial [Didymodactylos carnosus]
NDQIQSRHFFQFGIMILSETHRNPLDYNDYGCHCGANRYSIQQEPLDDVDKCCQQHDLCYKQCTNVQIPQPSRYVYKATVVLNDIVCKDDQNTCGYKICMCDKQAAECFGKSKYNAEYKNYDIKKCTP